MARRRALPRQPRLAEEPALRPLCAPRRARGAGGHEGHGLRGAQRSLLRPRGHPTNCGRGVPGSTRALGAPHPSGHGGHRHGGAGRRHHLPLLPAAEEGGGVPQAVDGGVEAQEEDLVALQERFMTRKR